ncbi:MAG: hypothetical protein ABIG44_01640 [Planctomycetota bacterium]
MADKFADGADAQSSAGSSKRSWLMTTLTVVVVVALVEAGAVFLTFKFFGTRPNVSYGETEHVISDAEAPGEPQEFAEVSLLRKFKVPNNKSGRTVIYDFDISLVVPAGQKEALEELVVARDSAIRDRVAQTIRQASQRVLNEDDFETLRILLKHALGDVLGDEETVARVLIPRCVPIQTD